MEPVEVGPFAVANGAAPVVISHPGRQHSYQTALAAQDAGLLCRYLTAFYSTGRPLLPRVWRAVPRSMRSRLESELRRRWHPDLDPEFVSTFPMAHLTFQLARRALPRPLEDACIDLEEAANVAFDRRAARWLRTASHPRVVHGFEGGCLETLRAARRAGCITVLDVPSRHEEYIRIDRIEALRWGLRPERHPARRSRRVQREREEADVLLVPSGATAAAVRNAGVPAGRIVLLPYGADPERFPPAAIGARRGFRVLFAGHIGLRKGVAYLLEAWSHLQLPASELLLVGDDDAHGRAILARYAGLYRRVSWMHHARMPELFAACEIFVLPSLVEGSPLVVYEAMAAGVPVIATESARAILRDGIDGIVVPERDPRALSEAISFLHRNPEARCAMGASARRRIQERFTWRHYRDRLGAIYRELLLTGRVTDPFSGDPRLRFPQIP